MVATALTGCGGGGNGAAVPPESPGDPPPVADPVDARMAEALDEASAEEEPDGMALSIRGADGEIVFESVYGDFDPERRYAGASASKLVTALTLLRLVEQQYLSLESTTGETLGWPGTRGTITLEQLLAFISGLPPNDDCLTDVDTTLADCVQSISERALRAPPGERFDYGGTHMQVAARMAEVVTGEPWHAVFRNQLVIPLGLDDALRYFTFPRQRTRQSNPRIAGGLVANVREYAAFLQLAWNRGRLDGNPLIDEALVERIARQPVPDVETGFSPEPMPYGLGAWLDDCDTPGEPCPVYWPPGGFRLDAVAGP